MRTVAAIVVLLGAIVAGAPARAAGRLGLGVKLGTYGYGVDLGVQLSERFGLRGSLQRGSLSPSDTIDGIHYDADVDLGGTGVLVDLYPAKGTFRLSAGLFHNRNDFELTAIPLVDTEIGDTVYSPAEVGILSGSVDFDDSAPYFGIGWGNPARGRGRVGFLCDLGFVKQGAGEVTLRSSNGAVTQADLDREAASIEDDIEEFDFWPVISAGVSIRWR